MAKKQKNNKLNLRLNNLRNQTEKRHNKINYLLKIKEKRPRIRDKKKTTRYSNNRKKSQKNLTGISH